MLLYVSDNALELIEILCRLTVEIDVPAEIKLLSILKVLYDDGITRCLTDKTEHLSMAVLSEDDNLGFATVLPYPFVLFFDTSLKS